MKQRIVGCMDVGVLRMKKGGSADLGKIFLWIGETFFFVILIIFSFYSFIVNL